MSERLQKLRWNIWSENGDGITVECIGRMIATFGGSEPGYAICKYDKWHPGQFNMESEAENAAAEMLAAIDD